jgi:hypothetical protein
LVRFAFETNVISWRGPAPFVFAPIPAPHVERLRLGSKAVTYGWGMIPVEATVKNVAFKTSLFPKDATYLLPIKTDVRKRAKIAVGDLIGVDLVIQHDRL